ncbi:MAG: protein kinase [Prevotellaceae bacterium]|jgi:serine/threonine protein kinase|nr:protein kinase [Prevotellaceae bacterium]
MANNNIIYEDYEKMNMLGTGSFATVFMVRHRKLGHIRAIRVLDKYVESEHSDIYKKFLEECVVLLRLGNGGHPNIVRIYQPMLKNNQALVEMDYIKGVDLLSYIQEQRPFVPYDEVIRFVQDISSALAYCHVDVYEYCMDREKDNLQDDPDDGSKVLLDETTRRRLIKKYRVIHNDIHAKNVMRRDDGSYILLDFGLAIDGEAVVRSSKRENGAPEYKAPEKWDKEEVTTQSDIYSFGILMYEMLTGQVPFIPKNRSTAALLDLMKQHQHTPPPPIEPLRRAAFETHAHEADIYRGGEPYKQDYPDWLEAVIMKCLAKNPEDRFADGRALYNEINANLKQNASNISQEAYDQTVHRNERLTQENKQLKKENNLLTGENERLKKNLTALSEKTLPIKEEASDSERVKIELELNKWKEMARTQFHINRTIKEAKLVTVESYIETIKCKPASQAVACAMTDDTWRNLLSKAGQTNPTKKYDNDVYKGETNTNGQRHGLGFYCWKSGVIHIGENSENKIDGYGICMCHLGENGYLNNCNNCIYYVGSWANGIKDNGKGTCYDRNGKCLYYGGFSKDKPTEIYPAPNSSSLEKFAFKVLAFDKDKYIGETHNGLPDGYGIYLFDNGDLWYGKWKNGVRQGKGILIEASGKLRTGTWDDNTYTAEASDKLLAPAWREKLKSAVYKNPTHKPDNERYKGQTVNFKRTGLGIYAWDSGTFYVGGWTNANFNGYGIHLVSGSYTNNCPNASYYVGVWKNHQKGDGKGTCYDKKGNLIYYGEFTDNKPVGVYPMSLEERKGYEKYKFQVIEYTNGDRYVGETVNGQVGGYGIYIRADDTLWYGSWKENSCNGTGILIGSDGSIITGRQDGDNYIVE